MVVRDWPVPVTFGTSWLHDGKINSPYTKMEPGVPAASVKRVLRNGRQKPKGDIHKRMQKGDARMEQTLNRGDARMRPTSL